MSLKARIDADVKQAMRARDAQTLGTVRLLMAAIKQREVDDKIVLDDAQIMAIIDKMLKQRRDSIAQFTQGGRLDLADKESAEISVLQRYLPMPFSASEVTEKISSILTSLAPTSLADLGKLMAQLKPIFAGRADMSVVSVEAKNMLNAYLQKAV